MNALDEFLKHIEGKADIKCVSIRYDPYRNEPNIQNVYLKVGYTQADQMDFSRKLVEINYDSSYGSQELYGTIWYTDGTWSDRREYDGSEWWEHQSCPVIIPELQ